jgi:phage FluMu gp28-like protein
MTISLRNLPVEIEAAIAEKSRREGISLNKAATQLLAIALKRAEQNGDFEEFAGSWNREAGAEFEEALAAMRVVDPQDWKA